MQGRTAVLAIGLVVALVPACLWGGAAGSAAGPRTGSVSAPLERAEPELPTEASSADSGTAHGDGATPAGELALPAALSALAPSEARAIEADAAANGGEKEFEGEALTFVRSEGLLPLRVPKDERLDFDVVVDLPIVGETTAGEVVLAAKVEPYVAGLPSAKEAKSTQHDWMGWIGSTASGSHFGYKLHEELKARLLPQEYPRIYYTDTQTGSENRRKELKLGAQGGKWIDWYRNDGHCKGCNNREHFVDSNWLWGKPSHCDGCKRAEHRVWRPNTQRDVPAGTVDMLSAVYLARSMVQEGRGEAELQLVDETKLWNVKLAQGARKRLEVPAGRFDCVEVKLLSSVPPGEPAPKDGFEGLFGLRGSIQIWLDSRSGVPVEIRGEFPIKLLSTNLDVYVRLKGYRGTPKSFAPVP